ncbi:hypothetical protein [Pseudogemmobacter faecipullorum]|uniref:Uncharacterized protein n=1 Tax=Pseudogemmobacter faecipullorum TaxID=2755041 RepID=A0ABS8CQY4_9RHOB|nr:hypothetical protein [Pseudogemmobacter faecipullorum]MCB5411799.1 hypothetical protein [Pseudogemmobacter faecipullorum]
MTPIIREVRQIECEFSADLIRDMIIAEARRCAELGEDVPVTLTATLIPAVTVRAVVAGPISFEPGATHKAFPAQGNEPISSGVSTGSSNMQKMHAAPEAAPRPANSKPALPQVWTRDEDDLVVASAIEMIGATVKDQAAAASLLLTGRTVEAVRYRMQTTLKARIAAEVEALAAARAKKAAHGAPDTARTPDVEKAPGAISAQAAGQDGVSGSDIAAHLRALPYPAGWGVELEVDMLERALDGQTVMQIADINGWSPQFIKMRFELLVGRKGTMPARFSRQEVLEALRPRATDTVAITREGEA